MRVRFTAVRIPAVSSLAPALAGLAALVSILGLGACGSGSHASPPEPPTRTAQPTPTGPAFGLTEDNAALLWAPDSGRVPPAFGLANEQLGALHPTYLRLLVDWAALQPRADRPPALGASVDGCARGVAPCGAYAGLREELAAIASRQGALGGQGASGQGRGAFQVVIDLFGVPAWAAAAPSGCEPADTPAFARALRPGAIASYRALIHSVLALGASEGVALRWWSPWNEPNHPRFLSPQRAGCSPGAAPLAPVIYAQLAQAMNAELQAFGGEHQLILGELDDLSVDSPHTTSVAAFIAALPGEVLCLGEVWSIHAYARYGAGVSPIDAVAELESALDARGGCARQASIWVSETGAGAPHAGRPRTSGGESELEGCLALARELAGWYADPRVGAVFQYSFREDPAFPVGLVSADLRHLYPTYALWLAYAHSRASSLPPPSPASGCA